MILVLLPDGSTGQVAVPEGYAVLGLPKPSCLSSTYVTYGVSYYPVSQLNYVSLLDSEHTLYSPARYTRAYILGEQEGIGNIEPQLSKYQLPCQCVNTKLLKYVEVYVIGDMK